MNIFREILDTSSWTIIQYRIDDTIETATPEDKVVLLKMQDTNKLDEVYALAHEHLGEHEKAKELRDWVVRQAARPKHDPLM